LAGGIANIPGRSFEILGAIPLGMAKFWPRPNPHTLPPGLANNSNSLSLVDYTSCIHTDTTISAHADGPAQLWSSPPIDHCTIYTAPC